MTTQNKDKQIGIRVTDAEKTQIEADARKAGFDSISAYFLWLYRNQSQNRQ